MVELALPMPGSQQQPHDLVERRREFRSQKLVLDLPNRLVAAPSVKLFGTPVPIGDNAFKAADENRVMSKVEEPGLFTMRRGQIAKMLDKPCNDERRK